MRNVGVGESVNVYFKVETLDGNPALNEAGNQPQILLNNGSWVTNGIGLLVDQGYGSYYAVLNTNSISVTDGDIIQTRYQGIITKESTGDTFYVGSQVAEPISLLCYGSVNEADLFFSRRLNTRPWDEATKTDKLKALCTATDLIDRLNFAGEQTYTGQKLQFPRKGCSTQDDVIPEDIKIATYHIAIMLLDDYDPEIEQEKLMVTSNKYQASQTLYDRSYIPEYRVAGIPSGIAWGHLKPYLRDARELSLARV